MSIVFPFILPTTGAASLATGFQSEDYSQVIASADSARARVRDSLKRAKRADDPNVLEVIKAIDDYLPYLFTLLNDESIDDLGSFTSSWRLPLKTSRAHARVIEPPKLEIKSVEFERGMIMLTYVAALCVKANNTTSSTAGPSVWNQATAPLLQAVAILRYLTSYPPRLDSPPPDLHQTTLSGLQDMIEGSIHFIIIQKTMAEAATISPGLLARVAIYATEQFRTASQLLSGGRKLGSGDPLMTWLASAESCCVASTQRFLALDAEKRGEVGLAIGLLNAALHTLGPLAKQNKIKSMLPKDKDIEGIRQFAISLGQDIDSLLYTYTAENKRLTFQPVPALNSPELSQNKWPSGRQVSSLPTPWQEPKSVVGQSQRTVTSQGYY